MLTRRFVELFRDLTERWTRYQDTPRNPSGVPALATARANLDDARAAIAFERDLMRRTPGTTSGGHPGTDVSNTDIVRLRLNGMQS